MTAYARRGGAVLGAPIAHSLSPALHTAAYAALGLSDWTYRAVECEAEALPGVLRALDDEGLAGVSLTMPLKRAVLPLLARVEGVARDVSAVNTVLFGGVPGQWWGGNTDVPGMVAALRSAGVSTLRGAGVSTLRGAGVSTLRGPACVLGGGATAASALAALSALGVASVDVVLRRVTGVGALEPAAERFGVDLAVHPWAEAARVVGAAGVVVSTVPAGATDGLASSLAGGVAGRGGGGARGAGGVLFDVVYAPWPTALASAWEARGGRVVGGLTLLVEQAALQVTLMTGREAPVEAMRAAGEAALAAG